MESSLATLDETGLATFQRLRPDAVSAVTERFYATHGSVYQRFGERGRQACRDDLAFHLEFLRPTVEFGAVQPMVEYLLWLESVLQARSIPAEHLGQSLEWLADFFNEHMEGPQGAIVRDALLTTRDKFLEAMNTAVTQEILPEAWAEADAFEAALLRANQREAMAIVDRALDDGHSLVDVELHVMRAALYHIGEQWQANKVSVAQEHIASAIVQSVMTQALLRSIPSPPIENRVLVACVEGNNHAIGVRMVADAFQLAGWDVQFLGANVPTTALVAQVKEWRPNLVCLSVSFAHHLSTARAAIAQMKAGMGAESPAVIVGGLAFNRFSQLAEFVGADSWATDPQSAVTSGSQLVGA